MSFVHFIPRPAPDTASTLDFEHLNRLHRGVRRSDGQQDAQEKQVAQQFEALLVQQMLKQSRQAVSAGSVFDSEQMRLIQGMRDDQMALQLSDPGMGLAQALLDQIRAARGAPQQDAASARGMSEAATSRLPHLRSHIGEESGNGPAGKGVPVASSISELISLLSRPSKAIERVGGAIQGAPGHIRKFVETMSEAARHASAESGIPTRLILSQAALESGWGRREIMHTDGTTSHNLFGIKATGGWKGKVVNITTTEYENGVARKVVQPFRAYESYAESFADYARLISNNKRYGPVLEAASAEDAARRIQAAGYATDPAYADKLISIMAYFRAGQSAQVNG